MEKVSCSVIQDLLSLYIDQVVSEDSRALVEEHLKSCPKCRNCLEELRAELPEIEAPQGENPKKELGNFRKFLFRKRRKAVLLSSALVLTAVLSLVIYLNRKTIAIDYEEAQIEFLQEDEEKVVYKTNIPGNYRWVTDYNRETGTMTLHFEQSLWERYISGLFNPFDHIHLILKKDVIKEVYTDRDGTQKLVWEAAEEEKEAYFSQDLTQGVG